MKGTDESHPHLLMLCCVPTLMHGAFIQQQMQLKILNKVKGITETLELPETTSSQEKLAEFKAVKDYVSSQIEANIKKIQAVPSSLKDRNNKENNPAQAERQIERPSLKAVRESIGKKRSYADKDKLAPSYKVSPSANTVQVEPFEGEAGASRKRQ